jgi:hypothetical protein
MASATNCEGLFGKLRMVSGEMRQIANKLSYPVG